MKLSDTALIVLNSAAARDDRLVPRRTSSPTVADVNACRALVKQGLVEVVRSPLGATDIVTVREDDCPMAFVIADAGFRALNLDQPGSAENPATEAPTAPQDGLEGADSQEATAATHAAMGGLMAAVDGGEMTRAATPLTSRRRPQARLWRRA